jgi:pimeloyl-ACP methyl ester carboxylesterase
MNLDWLDREEYPFQEHYFSVNGQKLHYIDEGKGEILLFVHGTPSWSFDFRNVIKILRLNFRCIAIDHIGFGLSEKPEKYDYSTINHSKTLELFIEELKLSEFSMVVHDFGGPIGLKVAMDYPEKIKKLVVLNSWLWSSKDDPEFLRVTRILHNPLLPFLYKYLNFSPRFILPMSFGEKKLPKHLIKQYTKPFPDKSQRNGPLAFAGSLLSDQDWFEELWKQKEKISSKPTLFIWGMKDPVIKPHNLKKFLSGFTNAQVVKVETAGHFPQEEEPETVAKAIQSFVIEEKK